MPVAVHHVPNDPSSTALDERDGKGLAPQAIEVEFERVCPLASGTHVHADGCNHATGPTTRDPETITRWGGVQILSSIACVHCCDGSERSTRRWETTKRPGTLHHDLNVSAGDLTTRLPKHVESRARPLLHSMHDGERHG